MFNTLTNKKIKVRPITRQNGFYKSGHDGHFMFSGTKQVIPAMLNKGGQIVDPFAGVADEDLEIIAKKLSKSVEDFSIYKDEKNFWKGWKENSDWRRGFEVTLDKEEKELDLSDPLDFIAYRVLVTNTDKIAPSWEERYNKGSFKWALVDTEDEVIEKVKSSDKKKQAYKEFGKMEDSDTRLTNFLRVYGVTVPTNASKDWKKAEVDKIIDTNIDNFLRIVEDPDYENRLFILDAVNVKAIKKTGTDEYSLLGGKVMGTMKETIKFIKDPKNQPEVLTIKARLEAKE